MMDKYPSHRTGICPLTKMDEKDIKDGVMSCKEVSGSAMVANGKCITRRCRLWKKVFGDKV